MQVESYIKLEKYLVLNIKFYIVMKGRKKKDICMEVAKIAS